MIEVGVNSYVTLEEAEEMILKYKTSIDYDRDLWNALDDVDKEKFLLQSNEEIENVAVVGYKYFYDQILNFPRVKYYHQVQARYGTIPYPPINIDYNKVPFEIKRAQVENALGIIEKQMDRENVKIYDKGVSSQIVLTLMRDWFGSHRVL